ncbi:unnamed protein product [Sphacelaria rigidula]
MRRALGTFGGSVRNLAPQMMSSSARASALPNRYAVHLARVREAMEELAPPGQALECEGRVLAAAQASQAWSDDWYKSPAENYVTANALFTGGEGVAQDKEKAFLLWKKAADAGHLQATYSYASCLRNAEGTEHDLVQAVEVFERLAEGGFPEAQYALALILSSGEGHDVGIPQDDTRARNLFMAAAREGFAPAISNTAAMLALGRGGEKDEERAAKWYEVAVDTGDPTACDVLGSWYCAGRAGLEEDWEKGFELHLRAANLGLPTAQYHVGVHFFSGRGVEKDLPEAARWFEKAADSGMMEAMLNLAKMTAKGMGVREDRKRALELCAHAMRIGGGGEERGDAALDEAIVAELFSEVEAEAANEQKVG